MSMPMKQCANPRCGRMFPCPRFWVKYCTDHCMKRANALRANQKKTPEDKLYQSALQREWRRQHPGRVNVWDHIRRARENNAPGSHTRAEWIARVDSLGWKCFYCGCELTPNTLTKDHFIALVNGGSNDAENLVPACRSCNSRKGARTAFNPKNQQIRTNTETVAEVSGCVEPDAKPRQSTS